MAKKTDNTQTPKKPKATPVAMVQVAQLDDNGVYHGLIHVAESDITDAHVLLPDGCDLPPNKYYWDREQGTFVVAEQKHLEPRIFKDADSLDAIAKGFSALHAAGLPLPPETIEWLQNYRTPIDQMAGNVDDMKGKK